MAKPSMETSGLDRILTLEIARVTERAAVAAARLRGRGDEMAADQVAVDAMRQELNRLPIDAAEKTKQIRTGVLPPSIHGAEVSTAG